MKKAVSVNDIADSLMISRATVSKVLNGKHVKEKTKKMVLEKAISLGYKNYDMIKNKTTTKELRILLLSSKTLIMANYYVYLIRGIESYAQENNVNFLQYTFRPNSDFDALKEYIKQFDIDGIICFEFFSKKNISEILTLNIPTVFIDFAANTEISGDCDIVLMENLEVVKDVCQKLINKNIRKFCFIGNSNNCKSFCERFLGLREALFLNHIQFNPADMITDENFDYGNITALFKKIITLPNQPECFICANDFIAMMLLQSLQKNKYPKLSSLQIVGFDNTPESKLCNPPLSTINIDKMNLGKIAIQTLIERIENRTAKSKIIYLKSNFICRETTNILL